MTVVTYIYEDFTNEISSTHRFRESVERMGYELINVAPGKQHVGNAEVLRLLCEQFKKMTGPVCYADGADTFFLRKINVPTDCILYSTEKAVWPPTPALKQAWADLYGGEPPTPWAYLNGGGYCGPAPLIAEFFEEFVIPRLDTIQDDGQAQAAQSFAFIDARKDGFNIYLDKYCTEFQSIAFSPPGDFSVQDGMFLNNTTRSAPALIHGNGRTPMGWIYDMAK